MSVTAFGSTVEEVQRKLNEILPLMDTGAERAKELHQQMEGELTQSDNVFRSVESNNELLNSELNQIKQLAEQFSTQIDEKKDAAVKSSDGYLQPVGSAFQELEAMRQEIVTALDKIEEEQGSKLDAMKAEVEGIMTETRSEIDAGIEKLESEARLTYQTVTGQHASQIIRTVDGGAEAAVTRLVAIDTAYKEAFEEMQQQVENAVDYAQNTLGDIQKRTLPFKTSTSNCKSP